MNDAQVAELAAQNGRTGGAEIGTSGLEVFYGQISKADNATLQWPDVYGLFNKYLRRDPQVRQMGNATAAMASKVDWYWELPQEDPTPPESAFLEFLHTIWDDLPGGQRKLISTYNHYIPLGWIWFENVRGRRNGQRAPNSNWVSVHNDGLIGFRDIAFRDHSSFSKWGIDDASGKLHGFYQQDWPSPEVYIPLDRSTHVTFGDPTSPEGLSPFEALWRLESFMYNLEIIMGIGSEHSAGYAKFQSEQKLTATDKANVKEAARALMAAQEGNHILLPGHITADIMDVPFSAGSVILEAVKFYGHLKAQVLGIQWMSLSLTGDAGSNASMLTSSNMWLTSFNAQMSGAARVIGEQLATQLRGYNSAQFGSAKRLPVLRATPVEANIDLLELAQFVTAVFPMLEITAEDIAALRRKSEFLPELEVAEIVEDDEVGTETEPDEVEEAPQEDEVENVEVNSAAREFADLARIASENGAPEETVQLLVEKAIEASGIELADGFAGLTIAEKQKAAIYGPDWEHIVAGDIELAHPVAIGKNQPTVTDEDDLVDLDDPDDIERMIRRIERMDPLIGDLLRAEASDE